MDFCGEMNCTFSATVTSLEASFFRSLLRLGAELIHVLPATVSYTQLHTQRTVDGAGRPGLF